MLVTQIVRCPDCGSMAQKHFQVGINVNNLSVSCLDSGQVTARTECHNCDYFLEICMTTGQVLASHVASVFQFQDRSGTLEILPALDEAMLQIQLG